MPPAPFSRPESCEVEAPAASTNSGTARFAAAERLCDHALRKKLINEKSPRFLKYLVELSRRSLFPLSEE